MKRLFSFLSLLFVVVASFAISVGSPNQRIKLFFELGLKDSVPTYQVFFDDKEVIAKSELGFLLDGDVDLKHGFAISGVDINNFSSTWKPVLGQYAEIKDNYNQ
ncbi:MAG: glycoside hydrolase family 97 N-terminal domain-containing protein, partial [Paludibacteraceae bacterium]|nr:glycoside hydrolase family 97 N-terminal domain-containing protein [Paludibacteraceae bacterium]